MYQLTFFENELSIELKIFLSSIPKPDSYEYIRTLERLSDKIGSTVLVYFYYCVQLMS